MRKNGQITVFLSLVLVCIFSLLCGILESTRTAGSRCYLQTAIDSSIQSVFSQYHRKLWQKYRILGLEYVGDERLREEFRSYLEPYLENGQFYPMSYKQADVKSSVFLTDNEGVYFQQEILDYMKYGIWDFDLKPETAGELFTSLKEAYGAGEVSSCWQEHAAESMELERALENIMNSVRERDEIRQQAVEELGENAGGSFQKEAHSLIKEINRMPQLVRSYVNCAEKLETALAQTEVNMESRRMELGETAWNAYQQELGACREYTRADGSRRQEVEALGAQTEEAVDFIKDIITEAEEIEDYISSWEPEDEGEELDEDSLWEPLREKFAEYRFRTLSCQMGVQDKESQGILEQVKHMAELNIMKLVLPEGAKVSKAVLPLASCPSQFISAAGNNQELQTGGLLAALRNRIIVDEYGSKVFLNFLVPGQQEAAYETEYIIAGKNTDEGNLEAVVNRLLAVREGANLLYLLTDQEKRTEAQALAASIVGVAGLVPLVPVVTFFILSIWALGESLGDVKQLLGGGKVAVFKSKSNWRLSLEGLMEMGRQQSITVDDGQGEGLDYEGYLKLLLFSEDQVTKLYRMMDIIQINIQREQPGFSMSRCQYSVDMGVTVCGKHVFLSLGLLKNTAPLPELTYNIKMNVKKAYGQK